MNKKALNLLPIFGFIVSMPFSAFAVSQISPRSEGTVLSRQSDNNKSSENIVNRSATVSRTAANQSSPTNIVNRIDSGASRSTSSRSSSSKSSAAIVTVDTLPMVSRSARTSVVTPSANVSRSAMTARSANSVNSANNTNRTKTNVSRATAIFNDTSAIGGGYTQCTNAYNTCMDQFCGKSNDTYRRCFCSSRLTEFQATESALDEARSLLIQFQNNSLEVIGNSAAEVDAMYNASIGEEAIKNDTSTAQDTLNEISDLLSGKTTAGNNSNSLGILDLDLSFTSDIGDIFSGGSSGNVFGGASTDLIDLSGERLYEEAHKQCADLVQDSCSSAAIASMATSSYGILINQDCNLYEKSIDAKKEAVETTVAEAERILRDARLEEYRSNNSADVNECITAVKEAITGDAVCGTNYIKCLDNTGQYMNATTGEPIYSPALFQLVEVITLGESNSDVLSSNRDFDEYLESKKIFAEPALSTCQDISEVVWEEFKRSAIIEIAQAQDAAIQSVKDSCVQTMADCYNTQTGALENFSASAAEITSANIAYTTQTLCQDQVATCAALYGNGQSCEFDNQGRLINADACGLTELLNFVDTVDEVHLAQGCSEALTHYAEELCTPSNPDAHGYPWNCRFKLFGDMGDDPDPSANASIIANLKATAMQNCVPPGEAMSDDYDDYEELSVNARDQVNIIINGIRDDLYYQLSESCAQLGGFFVGPTESGTTMTVFYTNVFGTSANETTNMTWGKCVENTTRTRCLAMNTADNNMATYNETTDTCSFTEEWYEQRCAVLGNSYYEGGICYAPGI